jgi:hypothetical protein
MVMHVPDTRRYDGKTYIRKSGAHKTAQLAKKEAARLRQKGYLGTPQNARVWKNPVKEWVGGVRGKWESRWYIYIRPKRAKR